MSRSIYINRPITDLARSVAFYEAIGASRVPAFSNEAAAMMQFTPNIAVMLLTHDFYRTFTTKPIADPRASSSVLLCISCEDRGAVDRMVEAAAANGGAADPSPTQDMGSMYGRSFTDPDGHHWEPMWMDAATVAQGAQTLEPKHA